MLFCDCCSTSHPGLRMRFRVSPPLMGSESPLYPYKTESYRALDSPFYHLRGLFKLLGPRFTACCTRGGMFCTGEWNSGRDNGSFPNDPKRRVVDSLILIPWNQLSHPGIGSTESLQSDCHMGINLPPMWKGRAGIRLCGENYFSRACNVNHPPG